MESAARRVYHCLLRSDFVMLREERNGIALMSQLFIIHLRLNSFSFYNLM